jgi:exonuclease VII small subunit
MKNATKRADDNFEAIVSDLIALVEHVQASIDLINGAISREATLGEPDTSNVIVLDDVTPQYPRASYALNTCSASLDMALKSLLDARGPARRSVNG